MNSDIPSTGLPEDAPRPIADWTLEQPGIAYQSCRSCRAKWYFQRRFCPHCGAGEPVLQQASGRGTVYSVCTVYRAPTEELRPYTPYTIVLVDMEEGFRMMAHGGADLAIGRGIQASYREIAGKLMPFFESVQQ